MLPTLPTTSDDGVVDVDVVVPPESVSPTPDVAPGSSDVVMVAFVSACSMGDEVVLFGSEISIGLASPSLLFEDALSPVEVMLLFPGKTVGNWI